MAPDEDITKTNSETKSFYTIKGMKIGTQKTVPLKESHTVPLSDHISNASGKMTGEKILNDKLAMQPLETCFAEQIN